MQRYSRLGLAVLSGLLSAAAAAEQPAYVSDGVLAQLRGRYLTAGTGGNITYFGVALASVWQTPGGSANGVAVQLQGQPGFAPSLTTYTLNGGGQSGPGGYRLPQGLAQVQGVAQATQVSGSGNGAINRATITIVPGQLPAGEWLPPGNWQLSDGSGVSMANNRLTLELNQGQAGKLMQSIGGGQLSQFARVNSDGANVENSLNVQVGIQPGGPAGANNFAPLLQQLKGLPR
jgi:hypothetical protein